MTALDPTRSALEEERDFLLRSLDDLDAEHEAGDLADDDYEALRDSYTSRAADVLRQLDSITAPSRPTGRTAATAPGSSGAAAGSTDAGAGSTDNAAGPTESSERDGAGAGRSGPTRAAATGRRRTTDGTAAEPATAAASARRRRNQRLGLLVGVLVFAGAAGFALARSVGERGAGASPTGGTDPGTRTKVLECQNLGSTGGDLLGALKCFDEILKDDPQNAEALAYRGWYLELAAFQVRDSATDDQQKAQAAQLIQTGLTYLDRSIAADPTLPDPLAFRAIVFDRLGQPAQVCADVSQLLALNPPDFFKTQTSGLAQRNNC